MASSKSGAGAGKADTAHDLQETQSGFLFDPTVLDRETPEYLIPKMGGAISDPAYYQRLILHDPDALPAESTEITKALDPFAPMKPSQAPQRPVEGVLLSFEQAWRQDHLALGRLLHSLSLAPGEVTKIAVMDFNRRTAATSSEIAEQGEQVTSRSDQGSAQHEIQQAVADEVQRGSSTRMSSATQTQAAMSGGGLFFSGSGSTASSFGFGAATATSASSSRIAADSARVVQQRTVATSQAVRSRRATEVREVSESESQTATTRVIANYNHMHALTMMFFEVIQIFKLSTRVIDAERVVFVPMLEAVFDDRTARTHAESILNVLADLGRTADAETFRAYLARDTITMRRDADRLVTSFELAIATAANSLAYDAPITTSPPNVLQIDEFFRVADQAIAKPAQASFDRLDRLERDVRKLKEAWGVFAPDLQNIRAQAMFEAAAIDAIKGLGGDVKGFVLGPPEGAEVERFLREADQLLARRRAEAVAALPALAAQVVAAKEAWRALQAAEADLDTALRIVRKIDAERLLFNQALWMRTDSSQYQRLVSSYAFKGTPLGHLMDPRPIGLFGTFVAFRLPHATPDGDEDFAKPYVDQPPEAIAEDMIALPSGGVFGEAVLGQSVAAEKIDLTRFWNWQDSPIPILPPAMQPLAMTSRARDVTFSRVAFDDALAKVIEQALPEGLDSGPIIAKVKEGVRDMSGAADIGALIAAQVAAAQGGAKAAGDTTLQLQKNVQDFTLGMANSELAKAATKAIVPGAGGSATVLGGVLGAAKSAAAKTGGGSGR